MKGFDKYPLGSKWLLDVENHQIPVHIHEQAESLKEGKMLFVVSDSKDEYEAYGLCESVKYFDKHLKEIPNDENA